LTCLLSSTELDRSTVETLFSRATELANGSPTRVGGKRAALALHNPSSPPPFPMEAALAAAGLETITVSPAETLADTAREISRTAANVVLFSYPQLSSASEIAAVVQTPLINAGDGANENPLRALMDAFAIRLLKANLESIRIAILGNLRYGAEAHSLARILGLFEARLSFVTTAALSMPYDLTDQVRATAYEVEETNDLTTTLRKCDVLYLANIDPVRVDKKVYDKYKNFYTLTPELFAQAKEGLIVLGEWDGADALLASTRPQVERAGKAMLLTLIERFAA
jgi:aspartate carbamoyltransferase catalytic subunit